MEMEIKSKPKEQEKSDAKEIFGQTAQFIKQGAKPFFQNLKTTKNKS